MKDLGVSAVSGPASNFRIHPSTSEVSDNQGTRFFVDNIADKLGRPGRILPTSSIISIAQVTGNKEVPIPVASYIVGIRHET